MRDASVGAIRARQRENALRRRLSSTRLPAATDEDRVDFFHAEHAADRAALKATLLADRQRQQAALARKLQARRKRKKVGGGGSGRRRSAFGFDGF